MGRFVERMRAVGGRRAALIVVITAVVAVGLYFGVRETGVSERTEARAVVAQERAVAAAEQGDGGEVSRQGSGRESDGDAGSAEPLVLTLSAPLICEAHYPDIGGGYDGERWWYWESAGTMEVSWAAAGGDGSYTVTIVGETYTGATGMAEVSCALEHGPVSTLPDGRRIHAADDMPLVDSGPKTVSGRVVDGSGATATASVDVYAVLNRRGFGSVTKRDRDGSILRDQDGSALRDSTLKGGKTYRIDGILMTVPVGVDLDVGTSVEYSPGPDDQDDRCCTVWEVWIVGNEAVLYLHDTVYEEASRDVSAVDAIDANRIFDEFLASFGQPPKLPGDAEPLTLTLSAPEICEATRPEGGWTHGLEWNEEEQAWRDIVDESWWYWDSAGTMEVTWSAAGGNAEYTVTIADETYTGATGTAEVSCAMEHGPVSAHPKWGQIHAADDMPLVDSGPKTVSATVVDGSGATATASVDVYAVLNRGLGSATKRDRDGSVLRDQDGSVVYDDILEGGKTYRIDGILMTVPSEVDLVVGERMEYSPGSDDVDDRCCSVSIIWIAGSDAALVLWDTYEEANRVVPAGGAANAIDANRAFDEFLASFGQPPKLGDN